MGILTKDTKELERLWLEFKITRCCPECGSTQWEAKIFSIGTRKQHWRYNCNSCRTKWCKPSK